jgi:outer membrane usher protein
VQPTQGVAIYYQLLSPANSAPGPGRLEASVTGPHGELRSSVLVNPVAAGGPHLARLDTAWQTQAPGPLQTLVLGDTLGSGGGWSRPVRFGGVRFGRSLALRPGFIALPQGATQGAALPSATLPLAGGGFNNLGGAGNAPPASAIPLHQPAIASPVPLPAGASDYEVEMGRLRNGWGTPDAGYGDDYAAAAYRAGLAPQLTAEARTEWTQSRTAAGLELIRGIGAAGSVRAVVAQSRAGQEAGLRWGMGLVGNSEGAAWSLAWDAFDRGFTQLAATPGEAEPRGRVQADARLPLGPRSSAGLSYMRQTAWDSTSAGVLGLSAQMPVLSHCSLALKYSLRAGPQPGWQAGLTLAVPLDRTRL